MSALRGAGAAAPAPAETRATDAACGCQGPALVTAAYVYGEIGRRDRARAMLHRLEGLGRGRYRLPTLIAAARLGAGDRSGTLDGLEEALREHDLSLPFALGVLFPGLDGEPRYEAVGRKVFGNNPAPRSFPRAPLRSS